MHQENRVRNLSTRWLTVFKVFVLSVYTALCTLISYVVMFDEGRVQYSGLIMLAAYGWIFYLLFRMIIKLKRVEFDDQFLYVLDKKQDLVIPLENIESVEIATVGGIYKVNLYQTDQVGTDFYFKQSLWYPFNYKRCDALVNVLRKKIEVAKRSKDINPVNALHS